MLPIRSSRPLHTQPFYGHYVGQPVLMAGLSGSKVLLGLRIARLC